MRFVASKRLRVFCLRLAYLWLCQDASAPIPKHLSLSEGLGGGTFSVFYKFPTSLAYPSQSLLSPKSVLKSPSVNIALTLSKLFCALIPPILFTPAAYVSPTGLLLVLFLAPPVLCSSDHVLYQSLTCVLDQCPQHRCSPPPVAPWGVAAPTAKKMPRALPLPLLTAWLRWAELTLLYFLIYFQVSRSSITDF